MNSRQRTIAAINRRPPDRVPIDLNPTLAAYEAIKNHLRLNIPEDLAPNTAMEVIPHPQVLQTLGVDMISVKFPSLSPQGGRLPEERTDEWGLRYRLVRQTLGAYYEVVHHPLANATLADVKEYPWPTADLTPKVDALRRAACDLHEQTDLALVGRFGAPILEIAAHLLGMEEWYVRLATDQDFVRALLDKIAEAATGQDLAGIEAAGEYLQILKVSGEDLGMQTGPLYSMQLFHEVLLPPLRRRWQEAREALLKVSPSAKIMLHSCGGVRTFIPDLIAAGIDILDPVQPLAQGMDPEGLRRDFPDLVFHGGLDVQRLLPYGSEEEVARQTLQCLQGFQANRGGFILAPSHNVQADVPPRNILAMIRACKGT